MKDRIRKFILSDIRCFQGRQEFNIRPLTFLVGENSTGKSTVLGCIQALGHHLNKPRELYAPREYEGIDFNREPYEMGAFSDISRKTRGPGGKNSSFHVGFEFQISTRETMEVLLELSEREKGSEPIVRNKRIIFQDGEIVLETPDAEDGGTRYPLEFSTSEKKQFLLKGWHLPLGNPIDFDSSFLEIMLSRKDRSRREKLRRDRSNREELRRDRSNREELNKFLSQVYSRSTLKEKSPLRSAIRLLSPGFGLLPPYSGFSFESFAPIRSRPKRTYNPEREIEDPEGSEIPMVLMNMDRSDSERWNDLKERLEKFGTTSGLFQNISVRKLGRSTNDPFQLQVRVRGPRVNMIDVGYGVNQILPILVRILRTQHESPTFLMQQPEVHLHPRGQAELSSLFATLVKQRGHNFVIETHSDSMISRARVEIMNKRIAPEDVSLIYLEPTGNSVEVHNIQFDEQANLLGAPSGYRDFFLNESDKLLGFIKG